jgi:hypothetical protein
MHADGNIYVLDQGHSGVFTTPQFKLCGHLALGAAYTPYAIDGEGRGYAQNHGHLFVVGKGGRGAGQQASPEKTHHVVR